MQTSAAVAGLSKAVGAAPLPVLLAAGLELALLLTHAQVLFAIGPSHSFQSLKSRRLYFAVDLLSPWLSLHVTAHCLPPGAVPSLVWYASAAHALLHCFYIATWHTSTHTDRVIRLSSCDAKRRFRGGTCSYGLAELAWFHAGTAFDMAVHAAMLWLLSGPLVAPSRLHAVQRPFTNLRRRSHAAPSSRRQLATAAAAWTEAARAAGGDTLVGRAAAAADALNRRLPAVLLGVAAWAWVQPHVFLGFHPATWQGQSVLAATMLAVGLATPLSDFRRVLRSPGRALDGWAAQLIAMPVLALALCYAMALPLPYAIGLCLVACCPGGSAASVVGHLAGADVPLSVLLTAASALAAGVTVPLLGKLLLGTWLPAATSGLALSTLQAVLLPALAGSALGEVFPGTAATLRPLCTLAAAGLMAVHCASYIAHSGGALRYAGPRLLGAVIAMHAGSLLLGYGLCRMLGQPQRAARSAGIQASMRNSALAGQLAVTAFSAHPAAALPCALSACVHSVFGTLAALYFKTRDGAADGQRAGAAAGEQRSSSSSSSSGSDSSSGGGGGGGGGGSPPGGPEEPFSALLEAVEMVARQVAPLAQRASAQLAPLAAAATSTLTVAKTTTRAGVHAALQAGASLLVPGLMEELEGQLKGLEQAELDPPPQAEGERGRPGIKAPANPLAMNVVMVGAECAPWSKTGGLGDVMQALPKALAARGHRLMVVAPMYKQYPEARDTGVRMRLQVCGSETEVAFWHARLDGVDYAFLDHPAFRHWADQIYGGTRQDVLYRCALLSKAALEAPRLLPGGEEGPLGEGCVFVANDFHTALVPVYLQAHYRDHGQMLYARSLLVVHNLAHQGRGPPEELGMLDLPDPYYQLFSLRDAQNGSWMMNVLKAGAIASHRIVAVSNQYAQEVQTAEHGFGLDDTLRRQAWKLTGVVNGIDTAEWSPAVDTHLQGDGYRQYDAASLDGGKAACKAALQRELGLPVDPDAPLLGFIGRLDAQKGVDLIADNYEWLMEQGAQLLLLGSGREDLEAALREMEAREPRQCRAWVGFSVKMAHRITAGVDLLLMPSRFEPCGLNQLYAMAYGTVPVVHAVGGLADTVQPFNPYEGTGTGWTFSGADHMAFRQALAFALQTYQEHPESFREIQLRGMAQDLSWGAAAQQYEAVLLAAKYQW